MRALVLKLFVLLSVALLVPTITLASSEDNRICLPFRGGVVDPGIVEKMLRANKEGRLFRIRTKGTIVGFCVNSAIGRIEARFRGVQGGIALNRKVWGHGSQALIMVDANSLVMNKSFLKDLLTSESFLDTYSYPKILFVSTRLEWLSHREAILSGMLSMHGVTRPVHFDVSMALHPNRSPESTADIIITAHSFIKRKDFNMNNLSFLVNDEVELCMRIEASLFKTATTRD